MSTAVFHDRDDSLGLLEELLDPATVERLRDVGVSEGWHALEVGAGRGSIAAWLTRRVGPEGRVVATDIDTSLLEELGEPGVEVLRHDVLRDAGLESVRAESGLDFFEGGSREAAFFRRVLEGAASLVASGTPAREEVERMQACFRDPRAIDCGWPRIGASGWKRGRAG